VHTNEILHSLFPIPFSFGRKVLFMKKASGAESITWGMRHLIVCRETA